MKVVLFSSVLCLTLGFFIGRTVEKPEGGAEAKPVVESRRRLEGGGARSKRSTEGPRDGSELARLVSQYEAFSGEGLGKARLMAWILQLTSSEIPGALEVLLERERGYDKDGVNHREIGQEMLALLARWYEVDGESMLAWVRGQKEWTAGETLKAAILTICDGFHRDPVRGFELCLDWIERGRQGGDDLLKGRLPGEADFRDFVLYQVGRWGSDPRGMLEQVDFDGELRPYVIAGSPIEYHGTNRLFDSNFLRNRSPENLAMRAFAKGLADSGRLDLVRELVEELRGGARDAFQNIIQEGVESQGWQALKQEIDRGNLASSGYRAKEVLTKMSRQGSQEAIDWYLSLSRGEEISRGKAIREAVVESGVFRTEGDEDPDPFGRGFVLDYEQAQDALNELERAGEPVDEARVAVVDEVLGHGFDEKLTNALKHLTPVQRAEIEERVIKQMITNNPIRWGGESLEFYSAGSYGEDAARELGLLGEIRARIDAQNAEPRMKLREILERMEAEAGQ